MALELLNPYGRLNTQVRRILCGALQDILRRSVSVSLVSAQYSEIRGLDLDCSPNRQLAGTNKESRKTVDINLLFTSRPFGEFPISTTTNKCASPHE